MSDDERIKNLELLYDQLSNWSVGIDKKIEVKDGAWDVRTRNIQNMEEKVEELEKIVQDRKEYDLYLAKGGLIEQMIIRYAELKERFNKSLENNNFLAEEIAKAMKVRDNLIKGNREVLRIIIKDVSYPWFTEYEKKNLLSLLDGKKDSGGDYTGMIYGEDQIAMEQEQGEKPPEPSETHALDALLHATAPIPLIEVHKLIQDSNNELISEFVKDWSFYMCLKFSNIKSRVRKMAIFENWMYKKWEARSK